MSTLLEVEHESKGVTFNLEVGWPYNIFAIMLVDQTANLEPVLQAAYHVIKHHGLVKFNFNHLFILESEAVCEKRSYRKNFVDARF